MSEDGYAKTTKKYKVELANPPAWVYVSDYQQEFSEGAIKCTFNGYIVSVLCNLSSCYGLHGRNICSTSESPEDWAKSWIKSSLGIEKPILTLLDE